MNFLTHTIHTHTHTQNCMCTRRYFSAFWTLSRPAACLLLHRNRITHWHYFAVPTSLATLSVYKTAVYGQQNILARCVG